MTRPATAATDRLRPAAADATSSTVEWTVLTGISSPTFVDTDTLTTANSYTSGTGAFSFTFGTGTTVRNGWQENLARYSFTVGSMPSPLDEWDPTTEMLGFKVVKGAFPKSSNSRKGICVGIGDAGDTTMEGFGFYNYSTATGHVVGALADTNVATTASITAGVDALVAYLLVPADNDIGMFGWADPEGGTFQRFGSGQNGGAMTYTTASTDLYIHIAGMVNTSASAVAETWTGIVSAARIPFPAFP